MFYYDRDIDDNIENLINDYAAFKANKAEYAKNENPWEWTNSACSVNSEDYLRVYDSATNGEKWLPYPLPQKYSNIDTKTVPETGDIHMSLVDDFDYAKKAHTEIIKTLQPFIDQTVDEMEYSGSPIYEDRIPKETLAQMVDMAMTKATSGIAQLNISDPEDLLQNCWGKRRLSHALIESLMFLEIYGRRRPRCRMNPPTPHRKPYGTFGLN